MVFADVSPAVAVASAPLARIAGFVRATRAAWRADRQRRLTLNSLLFMPAHQLRDLGISVYDVMQAMNDPNGCHRK
jgi:uncharacterized protein YjiS (DUF1127 family)